MKHLALLIPGVDRLGGAERQVLLLAHGLKLRGWRVSLVALTGTGGRAATELSSAGIGFVSLGMRKGLADPRGWIRFHRWLQRERPGVIHAHLPHAAWMARGSRLGLRAGEGLRLSRKSPAFLDTLHSSATGPRGRRLLYQMTRSIPDKVTAVSLAAAEAHQLAGMVDVEKLCVMPNGVDVEHWHPDAEVQAEVRSELGLKDEFLWMAAGRLEPVKDYPTLLQAMTRLPDSALLVIAGGGPQHEELTELSVRLGLGRRVRFLGFEQDVRRWMQAADGFVLSSLWEGLPMGLLEAGACGLPAVATNVPGTREVLVDGETGTLTPVGDAALLAGEMREMMWAPKEERRAMGMRAREHVVRQFSLETVLDRWEELYGELMAKQ